MTYTLLSATINSDERSATYVVELEKDGKRREVTVFFSPYGYELIGNVTLETFRELRDKLERMRLKVQEEMVAESANREAITLDLVVKTDTLG